MFKVGRANSAASDVDDTAFGRVNSVDGVSADSAGTGGDAASAASVATAAVVWSEHAAIERTAAQATAMLNSSTTTQLNSIAGGVGGCTMDVPSVLPDHAHPQMQL
jgi:hypothetical protein